MEKTYYFEKTFGNGNKVIFTFSIMEWGIYVVKGMEYNNGLDKPKYHSLWAKKVMFDPKKDKSIKSTLTRAKEKFLRPFLFIPS